MQSDVVIQVENLSKQYRLGEVSTGALAHDFNRWWHRVRGKENPYLQVTQTNFRDRKPEDSPGDPDYVWALKDVTFEIKRGDVLGIIGANGAGKSTLLKILSRVTAPTSGEIRIDGRIAALLEVGTGFHPDLTGRENVYLNGAIMGLNKAEIRSRLDDIVEFSGCARYLDTPAKRYSSGMVVRLGFAVAAHLEPDILIVDEVLAVGDAEFQKKCMGKMQDVAGHGRTVLFVSHNMNGIRQLCGTGLVLANGRVRFAGTGEAAVGHYLDSVAGAADGRTFNRPPYAQTGIRLADVRLTPDPACSLKPLQIEFDVEVFDEGPFELAFGVRRLDGSPLLNVYSNQARRVFRGKKGRMQVVATVAELPLAPGHYTVNGWVGLGTATFDGVPGCLPLHVAACPDRNESGAVRDTGYPVVARTEWGDCR